MLDITLLRKDLPSVVARLETRKKPQDFPGRGGVHCRSKPSASPSRPAPKNCRHSATSSPSRSGSCKAKGEAVDAVMAQVAALKARAGSSAARLEQIQPEMQALAAGRAQPAARKRAGGRRRDGQRRSAQVGHAARLRFRRQGPCRHRREARPGLRNRRQAQRLALHRDEGPASRGCTARSRSSCSTCRRRSTATPSATRRTSSMPRRCAARASCPSSRRDLFAAKKGGQEGEAAHEHAALYLIPTSEVTLTNFVRDEIVAADAVADQAHGAHAVLPLRSRQRRARHARHDPPAPVRQGRDGADRASRTRATRRWRR